MRTKNVKQQPCAYKSKGMQCVSYLATVILVQSVLATENKNQI